MRRNQHQKNQQWRSRLFRAINTIVYLPKTLKLTNAINWSWWLVLSPLLIPATIILAIVIGAILIGIIIALTR